MAKVKDRERQIKIKAAKDNQRAIYKGNSIRLSADFSAKTLQTRREWHDKLKVLRGKNLQPRILYPATLSFTIEGDIKIN